MAPRHPTSKRRPGKGRGEEPEDVFVAKVYEASTWAERNRLTLIVVGIVAVVLVVGVVSWLDYRERLAQQAVVQLEQIQQTVSVGDPETAKAELAQYLTRFSGTPYAGEARLLLAELYLQSDQAPRAVEVLEASDLSLREPMGIQIELLKGKAYEAAERLDQAEQTYLRVADRATMDFQVTEALADAARIRELRGNQAGAAELYQRIVDGLDEGDAEFGLYSMRLAEARAAAESGAGGSAP